MDKFLKMIELVKLKGVTNLCKSNISSEDLRNMFFASVEKAHPFVIFPKGKTLEAACKYDQIIENAPFSVYSLEMYGEFTHITIPATDSEMEVYCHSLLAVEISPTKFITFAHITASTSRTFERVVYTDEAFMHILEALTARITTEESGIKNVNEKIKIGQGLNKRFHKFKQVIYIKPKSSSPENKDTEQLNINWSHRWSSRGHWRRVESIGKNREGNYCVEGFTWVVDSVKGPKDLPFFQKTRIVSKE